MTLPVNLNLNMSEFVNLIKALDTAGIVLQNPGDSMPTQGQVKLPLALTQAFIRLDFAASHNNIPLSTLQQQFLHFMDTLVNYAIMHHYQFRNGETAQAEYLLAFLLYNNIQLSINGDLFSLRNIVQARLPQGMTVPTSEECIKDRLFPNITALSNHWAEHLKAKEQQAMQAQWLAHRAIHSFDNIVLNLADLTFVMEGFINSNKIQLFANNGQIPQRPSLSPELSQIMQQFVSLARSDISSAHMQDQLGFAFCIMMKRLIANAKTPNSHLHASQQMLGFLLHHDFEIKFCQQQFRISQIVMAEMSEHDVKLWQKHGFAYLPFLNQDWLNNQCYPGKYDLGRLLGMPEQVQPKPVVPYLYLMSQRLQQPAANHKMEVERQFRPQGLCY